MLYVCRTRFLFFYMTCFNSLRFLYLVTTNTADLYLKIIYMSLVFTGLLSSFLDDYWVSTATNPSPSWWLLSIHGHQSISFLMITEYPQPPIHLLLDDYWVSTATNPSPLWWLLSIHGHQSISFLLITEYPRPPIHLLLDDYWVSTATNPSPSWWLLSIHGHQSISFIAYRGAYTRGHFIWNLWNEPSASYHMTLAF